MLSRSCSCLSYQIRSLFQPNITSCYYSFFFFSAVASNATDEKKYILTHSQSSWMAARDYCRKHHTDLAIIETEQENTKLAGARNNYAWIGLYRIPWRWSDGSDSAFKNWMAGEPLNPNSLENCAAENPNHTWTSEDLVAGGEICRGG
uniref:C-type lectin domain-containing protein n=1 Tax=Salarias fasciatus TaxID=181472 RepID=A0A672F5M0_SALFA